MSARIFPWTARLLVVLGVLESAAFAAQPGGVEILKSHDLKRSTGSTWILSGEAGIRKDVAQVQGLSAQLRSAQMQQQALDEGNQNPKVMMEYYREQIDALGGRVAMFDQELANLGPSVGNNTVETYRGILVRERNAVVAEQNRLNQLISSLDNQKQEFQDFQQQFMGEVIRLRDSYVQGVDDLRKSVDEIMAKYAELGNNDEITKALADSSKVLKSKQKLGPSKELAAALKWLERFEGSVQSETIELHRENNVDHIDAVLAGKGPYRMVFDTGAGPTTISAKLAAELKLKPTGRTVQCTVADGSKVMAKEMIIPSVGVGRLIVKNVTCVAMPDEKGDVALLLGQSFLHHFDYKYTQGTGRLALTKVEPDGPAAKSSTKSSGKRKKR